MAPKLVVVHTTAGPGEAEIVKAMLEAAGIPSHISRESAGAVYGLTVGPLGLVDILVPAEWASEAEALLAAMRRGDLDDAEPDAGP